MKPSILVSSRWRVSSKSGFGSQREHVIAKVHTRYAHETYAPPKGVAIDGSLFYMDPPTNTGRELRGVTPH